MDRKAFLLGILIVVAATAAAAKMGRYPLSGIGRSNGATPMPSATADSVWDSMVFDSGVWG